MRPQREARPLVAAGALTAALLVAGCSGGDPDADRDDAPSAPPSGSPSGTPSGTSTSGGSVYDSPTCVQVRAGIDAFNTGDYGQTVSHFQDAVPLARRAAAADGAGRDQRLLLRAVRYYAELPAEEYPRASAQSPQFARWKAVTLGLCASDGQPAPPSGSPSDPGQQV